MLRSLFSPGQPYFDGVFCSGGAGHDVLQLWHDDASDAGNLEEPVLNTLLHWQQTSCFEDQIFSVRLQYTSMCNLFRQFRHASHSLFATPRFAFKGKGKGKGKRSPQLNVALTLVFVQQFSFPATLRFLIVVKFAG